MTNAVNEVIRTLKEKQGKAKDEKDKIKVMGEEALNKKDK
jgi:hypothetical protein